MSLIERVKQLRNALEDNALPFASPNVDICDDVLAALGESV